MAEFGEFLGLPKAEAEFGCKPKDSNDTISKCASLSRPKNTHGGPLCLVNAIGRPSMIEIFFKIFCA